MKSREVFDFSICNILKPSCVYYIGEKRVAMHNHNNGNNRKVFSIIVLNHDKADYTRVCLSSLQLFAESSFEILAVDNGSMDATPHVLSEFQSLFAEKGISFKVIRNATNIGAVRGRNEAMESAVGDYIVFMDNDVFVKDADWLWKLRERLDGEERRGIISPKLLFPWQPYNIEFAGGAVSPQGRVGYIGRGRPRWESEHNVEKEVQCLISACVMTKRQVFDEIGLLDEAYNPVQYEDIDFCYRARAHGWKVVYTPAVEMFHFENVTTSGSTDLNFRYLTIRNGMRFKERWAFMFSREDGPPDEELRWLPLEKKDVYEVMGDALHNPQRLRKKIEALMRV